MSIRKNTFLIKRSNVPGKIPNPGDLQLGELAINTSDVILYASGTTSNSILPIGWDRVSKTGDTMTGALYVPTISATTYLNLPIDVYVTGGTYNSGTATFTNNTGGTFNVTGFTTGGTGSDTYVTGFTYSSNTFTIKQNNGQTDLSVVANTMTGLTINGNLSATTISVNNYVDFNTGTTSPSLSSGRVFYNNTAYSLAYYLDASQDVVVNMGLQQYIRVHNGSGSLISKGKAVMIQSATNGLPNITLAVNVNTGNGQVVGLAASDISNGSDGFVLTHGILSGLTVNTFSVGDIIYLSDTTPGGFVASTSSLAFSARTNQIGYIVETGTTTGKIFVSINNENINLSLTDIERNILEGNVISTGVYEYTGMTSASTSTINIAPLRGWIVKNTYTYATSPDVINLYYTGQSNVSLTNILTSDITYLLINSGSTLIQQTTYPTPQERRENIFIGAVQHPNRSTISIILNKVDFDVSPMSALRDLWRPLKLINDGILVSANGANLNINTSSGTLYGNGIGWVTNQLNPDTISISANSPATFAYRTQTGGTYSATTIIDPAYYDLNGVRTLIGGGSNSSTNQRVFLLPTGDIMIQYGQKVYGTLTEAVAGSQTEQFTTWPPLRDTAILIGIISINKSATLLNNTAQAVFNFVSKFGEVLGGTGGLSTTTLQQAYDNSSQPEITINSTLDGFSIKNGTGNADNVTKLFEGIDASNNVTSYIRGDGYISGTTFQSNGFIANSNGLTATTISATTYLNLPTDIRVTGATYNNNTFTYTNNTGGTFNVLFNTLTGLTVNGDVSISGSSLPGGYALSVTGDTNFVGDVYVTGDLTYNGNLLVTGGTIIQSGLTANTIYTDYIDFNTGYTGTVLPARLQWDDGNGTLVLGLKGGVSDIEIGLENMALCYNDEATTLSAGTIVYVSGSQGNRPSIKRAIATSDGYSITTLGMVSEPIASGAEGFVTTFGMVNKLNTIGLSGGTPIWLSPSVAGGYTSVKPQAPDHTVLIGYVVRVSATVGSVFIHISNGWEIDELHDVRITGKTYGDLLTLSAYNGSDVWVNSKTLNGSYTITGDTTIGGGLTATTISGGTISGNGSNLTGVVKGNGTSNYLAKWTGSTGLSNSIIQDNGTNVGINTSPASYTKLNVVSTTGNTESAISALNNNIGASGIKGLSYDFGSAGIMYGIYGEAYDAGTTNIGVYGYGHVVDWSSTNAIGGKFEADSATNNYSVQLIDGTQGVNKVLVSKTSDGKANWESNLSGLTNVYTTTISATTYQNLPLDIYVTGGTYSSGSATFRNNSGGTFSVTGFNTGLVYFTESGNTATPNGTIPVVSFSATSAATNIDVAIIPKGTGALLAAIPDNAVSGGNKRGNYAVDWQMQRSGAARVASGANSVVIGGSNNGASGTNSISGGASCEATNSYTIALGLSCTSTGVNSISLGSGNAVNGTSATAIGASCTANGNYSVALGGSNTTPNPYAFAVGFSNTANASQAMSLGYLNTSSGRASTAIGAFGSTFTVSERFTQSTYGFVIGDTQKSIFVLGARTTGNTATTMCASHGQGTTPATTNQILLQNNNSFRFKGTIIGKQSASTNTAAWDIDGIIVRGATASSTTLLFNNVVLIQNTPGWGVPTLSANTTLGCLTIQVTGLAATNIHWTCSVEATEVIYA